MLSDIISALWAFPKALGMVYRHRLWGYVLLPGLISILLGWIIFTSAWQVSDNIGSLLIRFYPFEWGRVWIEKIAQGLGGLAVLMLGLILFKHLVLAISSPVMSLLSEKIERITKGGKSPEFNLSKAIGDTIRGVRIALRNIVRELLISILLFFIGIIIPVLSPLTAILIFLVQAFYVGFGNMDFTLERYYRVKGSIHFVRQHKGIAIANGAVFLFLLFTLIGFLFVLPLSTIAATTVTLDNIPATDNDEA